jgi:hypothetical protein
LYRSALIIAGLLLALLLAIIPNAIAGTASGSVNVSANAQPRIVMTIDTTTVDFGDVDLDLGSTITSAVGIQVKSNNFWDFSVVANSDLTGATTGTTIPIANLEWADTGSGLWQSFSLVSQTIGSNYPRGVTNFDYDYKITIGYDYPPDTYTTTITYTAVQI